MALKTIAFATLAAASAGQVAFAAEVADTEFATTVTPLLQKYCYECHGNGEAEAGLAFEDYHGRADVLKDPDTWKMVMNYVRTHEMPPKRAKNLPTNAEREQIGSWVEKVLFNFDPSRPDPGRVTIRRLNRAEYNNTIRDLVGVNFRPADDFPADNSGYGFDNIADVLSVPPVLLEKYLTAAGKIMDLAIPTRVAENELRRFQANLMERGFNAVGDRGDGWMPLNGLEEDHVATVIDATAGDYVLRVQAFANTDANNTAKLWCMIDNAVVHEWEVTGGDANSAKVYEARFGVPAGKHRFVVVNRRLRTLGAESIQGNGRVGPRQEVNVLVKWVEIEGPIHGATRRTPASALEVTAPGRLLPTGGRVMEKPGEAITTIRATNDGEYILRAQVYARKAGTEAARMEFRIDGKPVGSFDVLAPANYTPSAADRVFSMELLDPIPQVYELTTTLAAGERKFSVAYTNDFSDAANEDPNLRERDLILDHVEVVNPRDAQPLDPRSEPLERLFTQAAGVTGEAPTGGFFARLFGRKPAAPSPDAMARSIIQGFAEGAWRRPVAENEVDGLVQLYRLAAEDGASFEENIKLALKAALVSPHFLFRGEIQPEPDNPASVHPVGEYALASRLSYFLWSSMPDEELFALAARGELRASLPAQVRRMLASPKAVALVENFAGQWLELRNLRFVEPDKETFQEVIGTNARGRPQYRPLFDEELRKAMQQETERFFAAVVAEDRSVLDFLNGDYTFLNGRLARHYGIPGIEGEEFRRVSLAGTPRRGVLTHGSILTITSNPTRTSPVKRGKWVLENLLGTPPPPPPPDVPELPNDGHVATGTLRQQLEQHRDNPTCSSCHARMDPIGFGLENFNAIGGWRERDGEFPIDSSGELVSGESFSNASALASILAEYKRELFVRCLTEKMLTYALGRGVEDFDRPAIQRVADELLRNDFKFSTLVQGIAESVPFQMRRGENSPVVARVNPQP